jgi:hypothetical protein
MGGAHRIHGDMINKYTILIEKTEGKRKLRRPKRR